MPRYYAAEDVPGTESWQDLARLNGAGYVVLVLGSVMLMFLTRTLYDKEQLEQALGPPLALAPTPSTPPKDPSELSPPIGTLSFSHRRVHCPLRLRYL